MPSAKYSPSTWEFASKKKKHRSNFKLEVLLVLFSPGFNINVRLKTSPNLKFKNVLRTYPRLRKGEERSRF